jgi:hypothetical protein
LMLWRIVTYMFDKLIEIPSNIIFASGINKENACIKTYEELGRLYTLTPYQNHH